MSPPIRRLPPRRAPHWRRSRQSSPTMGSFSPGMCLEPIWGPWEESWRRESRASDAGPGRGRGIFSWDSKVCWRTEPRSKPGAGWLKMYPATI